MWKLFDYLRSDGANDIAEWTRRQQKSQITKLNAKLDMLERYGPELPPGLLADLGGGIHKLKVRGNVQLRPHVCSGPLDEHAEFTLLVGAIEKDLKLDPKDAKQIAQTRRTEIQRNPTRRVPHERVVPKPKK